MLGGQVGRVLQQRPAGSLVLLGDVLGGQGPGELPDLTAYRLQGVAGELDDVEGVEADHRLLGPFPYRLGVGRSQVHRDRLDTADGQIVEEPAQRGRVLARRTPRDGGGLVVRDQGQVLVVLTPRDFVHAHLDQARQPSGVQLLLRDPLAHRADGAPGDPGEGGHRGLVGLGHQPHHQILDVAREARTGTGNTGPTR